jgi:ankyrin repeat protein
MIAATLLVGAHVVAQALRPAMARVGSPEGLRYDKLQSPSQSQSQPKSQSLGDAALYNDVKAVESMIRAGADVNGFDETHMTPLMIAASEGRTAVAKLLIAAKADVNLAGDDGATPLMRAASADRRETMQLLIANGANVNAKSAGGMTALMTAAFGGYADAVRLLLASKADPNIADTQGRTALMAAAASGDAPTVEALLKGGANPNVADVGHGTPMTYAAADGRASVMQVLQQHGLKPNAGDFALAAAGCHADAVKIALASGVGVNGADGAIVPLLSAAGSGCLDVAQLLIDRGANVNAKDGDGWTPLIKAAQAGHAEMVQLLLDHGADMRAADNDGRTAWMLAAVGGHNDIADIFKRARANAPPLPMTVNAPPLTWSAVPDGARSFAVTCEDRWVVYNIPGDAASMGAQAPPGGGYQCHFEVYALDIDPELAKGLSRAQLLDQMKGHIIGKGEVVATYERQ